MQDFFDRKTFDPIKFAEDKVTLNRLRGYGSGRRFPSTALSWIKPKQSGQYIFLDLGCGDSRDWVWAKDKYGFLISKRIDLFHPRIDRLDIQEHKDFIQGDIAERIPYPNGMVDTAISQAVLDLIEPSARSQFFQEVNRVLKPGGVFACYMQWLQPGWGFDYNEELARAKEIWKVVDRRSGGFIATKI